MAPIILIYYRQPMAQTTASQRKAEAAAAQSSRPLMLQPRGDMIRPGAGHSSRVCSTIGARIQMATIIVHHCFPNATELRLIIILNFPSYINSQAFL